MVLPLAASACRFTFYELRKNLRWKPFKIEGRVYSLSHLHPFEFDFVVAAKDGKPEQIYSIEVLFSLHCFTRSPKPYESISAVLTYSDSRETRIIDLNRYKLSFSLPNIIRGIDNRKCFHTNHGSFFTVDTIDDQGNRSEYTIYFTVTKNGKGGRLKFYVNSAYVQGMISRPKVRKPVKFSVIAFNTKHNRTIRRQK